MINVGLIGYGRYGKKYYNNLLKDNNFNIVKVLRKSNNNKNKLFTNNKKVFFNIKKIDLYIIASPTDTHFEYLIKSLGKNKHIIVEKPLVSSFSEFINLKSKIQNYKKIILINHTDLYVDAYLNLKKQINQIGNIKNAKLIYGKVDPYKLKNITTRYKLPHFEWLPHPLAIIIDLFKDQNFKIELFEKRKIIKKFIKQNLIIKLLKKDLKIEIYFSNNFKKRKRNLEIDGSKGKLIYKGYNNKKCFLIKNKKTKYLKAKDINPIENLLRNFRLKFKRKKFKDDKKLIHSSTKYLFEISNLLDF